MELREPRLGERLTPGRQPHLCGRTPLVLVTEPTSALGTLTIGHLLRYSRVAVRAITPDPRERDAVSLSLRGVDVVPGDLDDRASLVDAAQGADAIVSIQPFDRGYDLDVRRGCTIAEVVATAQTPHLVHVSAAGADRPNDVPTLEARRRIERKITSLGLRATILRPAPTFESFDVAWGARALVVGALRSVLGATRALPMIALTDVGWFAARACERPATFASRTLEIAGDRLTVDEMSAAHQRATGRPLRAVPAPTWFAQQVSSDVSRILPWLRTHTLDADVAFLRRQHPNMLTLERWFRRRAGGEPASQRGPHLSL
jgi:uncharacterized protein YbjT (DUF2867 family)